MASVVAAAVVSLVLVLVLAMPWPADRDGDRGSADRVEAPPVRGDERAPPRREALTEEPRCRSGGETVPCVVWNVAEPSWQRLAVRAVGELLISVGSDGTVHARAIADGTTRWRVELPTAGEGASDEARILDEIGGTVPIQHRGEMTFLDLTTGGQRWSGHPPVSPVETAVIGAWLLVTDGRGVANLSTTGATTWQLDVGADERVDLGPSGIHLVRDDGTLERRSEVGGGVVWSRRIDAPVRALPVRAPGQVTLVAVEGQDPFLLGLDRDDGSTRLLLPLDGPVIDAVMVGERLAVLVDGPVGTVLHLARVTADGAIVRATGRHRLGTTAMGLRPPLPSPAWVAVVSSTPTPSLDIVAWDGPRHRHELEVAPYGVAADGPDTVLVATVDGVTARAASADGELWRVGLRSSRFVSDDPQHPPIVSHSGGLTRLTASLRE